jgi:hypothetical protein
MDLSHAQHQDLTEEKIKLISYIRENVIGSHHNTILCTPFGDKP